MAHHHKQTHSHRQTHTHTLTHKHTRWRTHTHAHRDMYNKAWICSAEEFLELYGKVEAVVRNCLLRWSGHLFEVSCTHLFDQCFCFKHISLFYAAIGAFFRWYPPSLYYTKDFTCRIGVNFNPCISATIQNFEKWKEGFLVWGLGNVSQKLQTSAVNRKYRSGQAENLWFW